MLQILKEITQNYVSTCQKDKKTKHFQLKTLITKLKDINLFSGTCHLEKILALGPGKIYISIKTQVHATMIKHRDLKKINHNNCNKGIPLEGEL